MGVAREIKAATWKYKKIMEIPIVGLDTCVGPKDPRLCITAYTFRSKRPDGLSGYANVVPIYLGPTRRGRRHDL